MLKTKTKNLALFFIIVFTFVQLGSIATVNALGLVTITVKNPDPFKGNYSWFVYEKNSGESIQDVATVKNVGAEPANVNLYAVDATSNEAGSFVLTFPKDDQKNIGIWTQLNMSNLFLLPNQSVDVPFTIKIPATASPGQYTGGIIVENSGGTTSDKSQTSDNKNSISVTTRIGTRIYLNIPGNIVDDVNLKSVSAEKGINGITRFKFVIENHGNLTVEPKVHIDVLDAFGNSYEKIDQYLGTSSPDTTIKPVVKMTKKPLMGNFKAKISITYECKFRPSNMHEAPKIDNMEIKFWVMPWEVLYIFIFFCLAALIVHLNQKNKKQKFMNQGEEYIVFPGDNLVTIAEQRKAKWQQIAKYNGIKAPFVVHPGQKIIVPKLKDNEEK